MLSKDHAFLLMAAADTKKTEVIDRAINKVRKLSPQNFLTDEEMKDRVFFHMPYGLHWSGKYKTNKKIPEFVLTTKTV
jgi:hypothetical protein